MSDASDTENSRAPDPDDISIPHSVDPDAPGNGKQTVHVVVANYDDDPHPHVEAVHSNEDAAEQHMIELGDEREPPHPIAWTREEKEVMRNVGRFNRREQSG